MADQAQALRRKSDGHNTWEIWKRRIVVFCILRCHILCTLKSRWDDRETNRGQWSFDVQLLMHLEGTPYSHRVLMSWQHLPKFLTSTATRMKRPTEVTFLHRSIFTCTNCVFSYLETSRANHDYATRSSENGLRQAFVVAATVSFHFEMLDYPYPGCSRSGRHHKHGQDGQCFQDCQDSPAS